MMSRNGRRAAPTHLRHFLVLVGQPACCRWLSLAPNVWHLLPIAPCRSALFCLLASTVFVIPASAQNSASPSIPPGPSQPAAQGENKYPQFRWDDHPSIRFGPGTRVDFRARFQANLRRSDAPFDEVDDEGDPVDLARRRIGIEGEILNAVDYQVEFEIQTEEPWRDVYANFKRFDVVQVQAGHFKLPFSLDESTSATNLDFAHRSRAADNLAPGRDAGVMLHGRLVGRALRYEVGLFSRDGRNARTSDEERVAGSQTFASRVIVEPFRSSKGPFRELRGGVAFTSSEVEEGIIALRGRTAFETRFYRPDLYVRGGRTRIGVEGQWFRGPFSLKSEYIRLSQQRLGQSVEDTDLPALVATGWYISGTWAMTGENKADGLDRPRRPLFRGGLGAIELAARLEQLAFGSGTSLDASEGPRAEIILGNADRAMTIGVNWYLNQWIKVQANVIRETLRDPVQGPLPGQPSFWSQVLRFQLTI